MAIATHDQRVLNLTNGYVFDGVHNEVIPADVTISDGRIISVDKRAPVKSSAGRTISNDSSQERINDVDVDGRLIAPGLIDAHFHAYGISLNMVEIESACMSYVALTAANRLTAAVRRGFTTVRDVAGGDPGLLRAITERRFLSPRYLYTGPALSQTGGHGDARSPRDEQYRYSHRMTEVVDGIDALRQATRDRFRRGAHAIKIMASGGVVSPIDPIDAPQYSHPEIAAVVEEARRRNSYVVAHAYSASAIRQAVEAGVRSIEHGNLLDREVADLMAERAAYLVPTLATYNAMAAEGASLGLSREGVAKNNYVLSNGQQSLRTAVDAGVKIGFGTDLMGELEAYQSTGLYLQAEAIGLSAALISATATNADIIYRSDLGRIIVGAVADLVVFEGNPFEDLSVLKSPPHMVIQNGLLVNLESTS